MGKLEEFTYNEYKNILESLSYHGYKCACYDNWNENEKSVILRHDVDVSLKKALKMAQFEHSCGVVSTYFILITADFYNAFNKRNRELIRRIKELGMEIGLHFDETMYSSNCNIIEAIRNEIVVMQQMLNVKIGSVSMHVPSKKTLEANYDIGKIGGGELRSKQLL